MVNLYGATETAGDILCYTFPSVSANHTAPPPAGQPIRGNEAFILDNNVEAVQEGELYVSGAHLAIGYLDDDALTATKFVLNCSAAGGRMYATGDLATYDNEGNIIILGRRDDYVKINGALVHLGVVSSALLSLPCLCAMKVTDAIVVAVNDLLCAVVQSAESLNLEIVTESRVQMRKLVARPEEVPDMILSMEQLPLLANS